MFKLGPTDTARASQFTDPEERKLYIEQAQLFGESFNIDAMHGRRGKHHFYYEEIMEARAKWYTYIAEHCAFYLAHAPFTHDFVEQLFGEWRNCVIELHIPPEKNPLLPPLWKLITTFGGMDVKTWCDMGNGLRKHLQETRYDWMEHYDS